MDFPALSEGMIGSIIAVGVSYGMIKTEVALMKEQIKELREHKATFVKVGDCEKQHIRTDKGFDELKCDVKDIKRMLTEWIIAHGK